MKAINYLSPFQQNNARIQVIMLSRSISKIFTYYFFLMALPFKYYLYFVIILWKKLINNFEEFFKY